MTAAETDEDSVDQTSPTRSLRTSWTERAGLVLLVSGLAVLGHLGWQLVGTDLVAQHRHGAVAEQLEDAWGRGEGAVGVRGTTASAVVRIPRFGPDYAVPLLEGTSDEVLATGIGREPGTAEIGGRGNLVLAAHRVTHGEPFAALPTLRPGDEVVVETAEGTFTYVLDTGGADLTVPFTAGWVTAPRPANPHGGVEPPPGVGDRLLTLVTCSELFHTDERLVAFAHLAGVDPA